MRWVSSAAQVRGLDARTIEQLGVPGIALMEVASRAVAQAVRTHHDAEARAGVVVVCGGGNNGGDGYACARWLHGWGYPVATWSLKTASEGDAGTNRAVCRTLGIPEVDELGDCGLIVDAVLGTGISARVRNPARSAIEAMDAHPAPVVAVDLPSGIDTDTGQPHGAWVRAVRTVTFGRLKPGLMLAPGSTCAGVVEVVDIGLDVALEGDDVQAVAEVPDAADLRPFWPVRAAGAHKGSSGHLLVVAGSQAMAGAAVLACRGALAAGAGLVTLLTASGALPRLGSLPPEVMLLLADGDVIEEAPAPELSRYDAILAGPGLGGGWPLEPAIRTWLEHLWELDGRPMVFDADALVAARGGGGGPRVITPHPGEAARMLESATAAIQRDRLTAAEKLAGRRRVALLKGPGTVVAGGGRTSINPTGGPVLATGGSGDVLSGVVGALLARGCEARDAARIGAWIHGRAGDRLAAVRADGWTASDVADAIPGAIVDLLEGVHG